MRRKKWSKFVVALVVWIVLNPSKSGDVCDMTIWNDTKNIRQREGESRRNVFFYSFLSLIRWTHFRFHMTGMEWSSNRTFTTFFFFSFLFTFHSKSIRLRLNDIKHRRMYRLSSRDFLWSRSTVKLDSFKFIDDSSSKLVLTFISFFSHFFLGGRMSEQMTTTSNVRALSWNLLILYMKIDNKIRFKSNFYNS